MGDNRRIEAIKLDAIRKTSANLDADDFEIVMHEECGHLTIKHPTSCSVAFVTNTKRTLDELLGYIDLLHERIIYGEWADDELPHTESEAQ